MENLQVQARYFNPFIDFSFKKPFGTELNKCFLIDFLNQITREEDHICDNHYLKTKQLPSKINVN